MNKPKELSMNKMKVMVIAVLVLVVGCFSLNAQTKINENKLTDISYVRKVCNITYTYSTDDGFCYELDNGKGCYAISSNGTIACVIVSNGELYGSIVINEDGVKASYNMHDKICHINHKVDDGTRQHVTSIMESTIVYLADQLGLMGYIK